MSDSMMNAIDVAYETQINIETLSTEQLKAEINVRYHQAESLASMSLAMLADAGRRLIEIKNRVGHGNFGDWCKNNLDFSQEKARQMMKISAELDDEHGLFSNSNTSWNIGISRVFALLSAPREVAAEIIETHDVADMTVRSLKEEIARLKEVEQEKHKIEGDNDNIRRELACMQKKLAAAVTESEFNEMMERYETKNRSLQAEIRAERESARADYEDIQKKLEDAKAKLKKQKNELKATKDAVEEEIKKGVEAALPEIEKKAKDECLANTEAFLRKSEDNIRRLEAEVERLEAEKEKLSNTSYMEFKVYTDQLQDAYIRLCDIIAKENQHNEESGAKLKNALKKIVDSWLL